MPTPGNGFATIATRSRRRAESRTEASTHFARATRFAVRMAGIAGLAVDLVLTADARRGAFRIVVSQLNLLKGTGQRSHPRQPANRLA
jgi:hypothetical protein